MKDEIKPALSAEEFEALTEPSNISGGFDLDYTVTERDGEDLRLVDRHRTLDWHGVLAAANTRIRLEGQPFGFTREDVDELRAQAREHRSLARGFSPPRHNRMADALDSIADRIAALLPPQEPGNG